MSPLDVATTGVAGLVAKATLVLCLALTLAWLARRRSARTLHLLWTTTFVVLLALPVVSLLGPSWPVPILPVPDADAEVLFLERAAEGASAAGTPREVPGTPVSAGSPQDMSRSVAASGSSPVDSGLLQPGPSGLPSQRTLSALAFIIWTVGCGTALMSLVVGGLRFRKLVRAAVPVRDPGWLRQADSIRRHLRMRRDVPILSSARATTPMTGGLWRPVILVPSSAEHWTPDRREVVLAHELVHVLRRDALRHILGRVAAACYWFHPLGWLAYRLSAIAGERSCDEEVLALGTRPSEYARHLFSLASETAAGPVALALRMVQRSQLEDRILSILRRHRPRYSAVGTTFALGGDRYGGHSRRLRQSGAKRTGPAARSPSRDARRKQHPGAGSVDPRPHTRSDAAGESGTGGPHPGECGNGTAGPGACRPPGVPVQSGEVDPPAPKGEWTLQRHVGGIRICMRNRGNVEIGSQNVATGSADEGSWLVLESQAERLHRLVVTPGPGGLEYDWRIDGRSEVFDAKAEEWRDLILTVAEGYLEVQDVLAEEGSLREIGWAHRRHVSGLRRQIGTHQRHVSGLQRQMGTHQRHVGGLRRQIGTHQRHVSELYRQLGDTDMEVGRLRQEITRMTSVGIHGTLRAATESLERQADRMKGESRALRQRIEEYDLAERVREIEQQIEDYDLGGKIRELEIQIEDYDLDGRIRGIEIQIEEYNPDGKIQEAEARVEEFDADGRIDEIERSLEDEVAALRRIIG